MICICGGGAGEKEDTNLMKSPYHTLLSQICFICGFASIVGSIVIWVVNSGDAAEAKAHAERFGIFVGLWAPTFFILSNRFDRFSEKSGETAN